MGKTKTKTKSSGKGGAIFAIILALGGLGFGAYSFWHFNNVISGLSTPTTPTSEDTIVKGAWYAEYLDFPIIPSVHPTYTQLPKMNINITVNSGESVYISFNAKYTIDNSGVYEYVESFIYQDGVMIDEPYAYVGEVNSGSSNTLRMVSLQYSISGLAAGYYNFSIRATSSSAFNGIDHPVLYIQTYIKN